MSRGSEKEQPPFPMVGATHVVASSRVFVSPKAHCLRSGRGFRVTEQEFCC